MDKPFDHVLCKSCGTMHLKYQTGTDGRCTHCTTFNRKPEDFAAKKPANGRT